MPSRRLVQSQNKAPLLSKPKHGHHPLIPCRVHVLMTMVLGLAMSITIFATWMIHNTKSTLTSESTSHLTTSSIMHANSPGIRTSTRTSISTGAATATKPTHRSDQNQIQQQQEEEDTSVVFHFIISSDCSSYQLWETLASFHGAEAINQCGRFTWIISGCLPNDQLARGTGKGGAKSDVLTPQVMQQHVDQHFPPLNGTFKLEDCSRLVPELHFTPDYSNMSVYGGPYADGKTKRYFHNKKNGKEVASSYGNTYVFNNKPNGLLHWAEAHEHDANAHPDEAIVLIDPDFLFLSHFHLARPDLSIVGQPRGDDDKTNPLLDRDLVYPGKPAAASYGLGAQWLEFDLDHICGADSHCTNTTSNQVHKYFSAGPPYVIHRADVLALAKKWAALVPPTYDEYPLLYAEMYAYSMAAAHLQLKHNLINGLFTGCMVGWPNPSRWGKSKQDVQEAEKRAVEESARVYRIQLAAELAASAVEKESTSQQRQLSQKEVGPTSCFVDPLLPPPFLHYCNRYFIQATDEMKKVADHASITYRFFAKRRVNHSTVLTCDEGNRFLPFTSTKESEQMANGNEDWNTLAVCAIARTLNFARSRGCHRRTLGRRLK